MDTEKKKMAPKWLPDEKSLLKKLCRQSSDWKQMRKLCEDHVNEFQEGRVEKWEAIQSYCINIHPGWVKHLRAKFLTSAIDAMDMGRTGVELLKKLSITKRELKNLIQNPPEGYRCIKQKNQIGENTYILLPNMTEPVNISEKVWTYRRHETQPYLIVEFPFNNITKKWKKINIAPIADVDYGNILHDSESFEEYIHWIEKNPNVFTFFNGNIFKAYKKTEVDILQMDAYSLRDKLSRIAHKILWAQPGTNEESCKKIHSFDPLQFICDDFDTPYFNQPVYADIFWTISNNPQIQELFTFYCIHGRSNAKTEGGQINAARKPATFQDLVNFSIMAHIKNKKSNPEQKLIRDTQKFKIISKDQYIIICPCFTKFFGSEDSKKGHGPHSRGTVSCRLKRNGKYHTSS